MKDTQKIESMFCVSVILSVGAFIRLSGKLEKDTCVYQKRAQMNKSSLRSTALETGIPLKSENHPILLALHPL